MFALALAAGCSNGPTENGPEGNGGSAGTHANGGSGPAGSGPGGHGGSTGAAGTSGLAGSGPAGTTGTAGGTAGAPAGHGGSTGAGGAVGNGGSTGVAGALTGNGGSTGVGGSIGGGGGSAAGGSSAGGGPAGGSTGTTGCPSNATFCSGFEDSTQPAMSVYNVQGSPGTWTDNFTVDTAQKKNGKSSLRVKMTSDGGTAGSYRMLSVPATQNAFWARFWFRSDVDVNGDHNPFAMACADDAPQKDGCVEFAEDVGMALNTNDDVRWPDGYGRVNGTPTPYVLHKDTWYCVELSFDATGHTQQVYIDNARLINATNYPAPTVNLTLKRFKFGYYNIHGPEKHIWYDDVAVAPTRIGGCQ
jgi:hypothetical protein